MPADQLRRNPFGGTTLGRFLAAAILCGGLTYQAIAWEEIEIEEDALAVAPAPTATPTPEPKKKKSNKTVTDNDSQSETIMIEEEVPATATPTKDKKKKKPTNTPTLEDTPTPTEVVEEEDTATPTPTKDKKKKKPTNTPTLEDTPTPTEEVVEEEDTATPTPAKEKKKKKTDTPTPEDTPTATEVVEEPTATEVVEAPTATPVPEEAAVEPTATPEESSSEPTPVPEEGDGEEAEASSEEATSTDTPVAQETPVEEMSPTPEETAAQVEIVTEEITPTPTETPVIVPTDTPTVQPEDTATQVPEVVEEETKDESGDTGDAVPAAEPTPVKRSDKKTGLGHEWDFTVMTAGYLVRANSEIPSVGNVVESITGENQMTMGSRVFLKLNEGTSVREDDRLVCYRVLDSYSDPKSGRSLGRFVKNLAVIRITRLDGKMVQGIVVRGWHSFYKGESVKLYEDEMERWKRSRRQKSLPADPLTCYVAGPIPGREGALMNENIILAAGEDQGVVAGMKFELRTKVEGDQLEHTWMRAGKIEVVYVGDGYSMAKILWCRQSVLRGFQAVYQP